MEKHILQLSTIMLLLIIMFSFGNFVSSERINELHFYIVYDPLENRGLMELNITIEAPDCSILYISLTIINEFTEITFLNYTWTNGLLVDGFVYNESGRYIETLLCGSGVLSAYFGIAGLFQETGFLSYSSTIDTTPYSQTGVNVLVEIIIPENYSVEVDQIAGATVQVIKQDSKSCIKIEGYGIIDIYIYSELLELTPTETPTTTQQQTPTETPRTPTISPIDSLVGVGDTRGVLLLVVATLVVLIVIAIYLTRRKK